MERVVVTICYKPGYTNGKIEKLKYKVYEGFPTNETEREIAEDPSIQLRVYEIDACNTPGGCVPEIDTIKQVFYSCCALEFFFQGTIFKSFETGMNELGYDIKEYKLSESE